MAAATRSAIDSSGREAAAPAPFHGTALRDYACGEIDRAIACLNWRAGRVHEGVHQARKSLRRTRAVLALGRGLLGPGADLVDREIRRLNRGLSSMRDAQALVETLDRLIRKNKVQELAPLLRRARRIAASVRADHARRALTRDPGLADERSVLTTLRAALPSLPWDRLDATHIRDALDAGMARVDAAGTRARESGRDIDWHRWRRSVRRVSQQHRAIGDRIADAGGARERVKDLAVELGEAQDFALLREHCGRRSIFAQDDRLALRMLAERGARRMRERIARASAQAPSDVAAV